MNELVIKLLKKLSMKSICGFLCTAALCVTMYTNSFTDKNIAPSDSLVQLVAALAFGCLGLTSVDKIWGTKNDAENKKETENQ
jgi:hypothetical protein